MKKIIILSAIIAMISNNNASGMLLRYIKPTSKRVPQKRHNINALPRKNIFNIDLASEPKNEIYGHLEDINDRAKTIAESLSKQINNSRAIAITLQQQRFIAIDHTFYDASLNIGELRKTENELKTLLAENLAISATIQTQASCLESKEKDQANKGKYIYTLSAYGDD